MTGFFENATRCTFREDVDYSLINMALTNVHTSRIADYPATIFLHNYADSAGTYRGNVFDANDGTQLGTVNFDMMANETRAIDFSEIAADIGFVPESNQFHVNIVFQQPADFDNFSLLAQQGIRNLQLDAYINMSVACVVNPESRRSNSDESIKAYLSAPVEAGDAVGLVAAIVDGQGIRAIASDGLRKADSSEEFLVTDLVHIGSNTKAMTSTMLATLVADGTFDKGWETTVADVFPELLNDIHGDYHEVTLWQLITMAGGIKGNAAQWRSHRDKDIIKRRRAILRDNLTEPRAADIGEFMYSNLAYMVAGSMAEKITGKSWEMLMQERLFEPLGMSSAGFGAPGTPEQIDQPWGHRRDNETGQWIPNQIDNAEALGPAGTVHVSIQDYAKFMALYLLEAPPFILSREDLDHLITPTAGNFYAAGWITRAPDWAERTVRMHTGSNTSWYIALWIAPATGKAYVAATNSRAREPEFKDTSDILERIIEQLANHEPN